MRNAICAAIVSPRYDCACIDICSLLQNLLPMICTELTGNQVKFNQKKRSRIGLAMLMQCLFATGRQRVPQFLPICATCYCVLNQTLPRVPLHKVYICCVMVYLRMPIRISARAWYPSCAAFFSTRQPHKNKLHVIKSSPNTKL